MNFDISQYVTEEQFLGYVRHAMTFVGGIGVVAGNFDPTQWQAVVGAAVAIVGVAWSHWVKMPKAPPVAPNATAPVTQ
jgi:uncharacterized membrane protein YphA (DoxX/SURF4 family)